MADVEHHHYWHDEDTDTDVLVPDSLARLLKKLGASNCPLCETEDGEDR